MIEISSPTVTVICGPMMSGKTYHGERFRTHYRCLRVVDWDCHGEARGLREGDLITTTLRPDQIAKRLPGFNLRIVPIAEARLAIGEKATYP